MTGGSSGTGQDKNRRQRTVRAHPRFRVQCGFCIWLHRFLTILQSRHRLRLYADDAVSYVVGGQHPKLVWGKRLQPADGRQELKRVPRPRWRFLLIMEPQRPSLHWNILPREPLTITQWARTHCQGLTDKFIQPLLQTVRRLFKVKGDNLTFCSPDFIDENSNYHHFLNNHI